MGKALVKEGAFLCNTAFHHPCRHVHRTTWTGWIKVAQTKSKQPVNNQIYQCLQGMPYSPVKFTGAQDVRCLQGMPYSSVKLTRAPDAQCLQGMPYSPVKFTRAPDAQCLQRDAVLPVKFTRVPDAQCSQGMSSPTNYPAWWYAVYYIYANPQSSTSVPYL